jgi:hypothetical protein
MTSTSLSDIPRYVIIPCNELPSELLIHREDIYKAKEVSPDDIWDGIADLIIKVKLRDNAELTKKEHRQLDRGSLSVNLFPTGTTEHNKFLKDSSCYHIQASTLTDFALVVDEKKVILKYSASGAALQSQAFTEAIHGNLVPLPDIKQSPWTSIIAGTWTKCYGAEMGGSPSKKPSSEPLSSEKWLDRVKANQDAMDEHFMQLETERVYS